MKIKTLSFAMALGLLASNHLTAATQTVSFTTPGGPYTFTVPAGVTAIQVEAVGGGGSQYTLALPYTRGADVTATLPVTPGQNLYIYVAGNGGGTGNPGAGGINGGGTGGNASGFQAGGGGGASDIRTTVGNLNSRILVAGGGGGSNPTFNGGNAGQPGQVGCCTYTAAQPGTAAAGGAGASAYGSGGTAGSPGTFGIGGDNGGYPAAGAYGGGGGGGWYGGGGGAGYASGAGGSSYVIPSATNVTNGFSSTPPSPKVTISYTPPTVSQPPVLTNPTWLGNGTFHFSFTNIPGANFTVLASTNVTLPLSNWTSLGAPTESPAGQYQFTDTQASNRVQRFYRVKST